MTNMRYDDITLFSLMSSKFIFYREARELYLGTSVPELHSAPSALEFYRLVVIFPLKSYLWSETGCPPTVQWWSEVARLTSRRSAPGLPNFWDHAWAKQRSPLLLHQMDLRMPRRLRVSWSFISRVVPCQIWNFLLDWLKNVFFGHKPVSLVPCNTFLLFSAI